MVHLWQVNIKLERWRIHNRTGHSFHTKRNHLQGMIDRLIRNREYILKGEIELRSFYEMDGQEQSQIGVLADFASVVESERMCY